MPFNTITVKLLEELKVFLMTAPQGGKKSGPVSQNTASTYFAIVKAGLKQAFVDEYLTADISERVKGIPSKESRRESLTIEEVNLLARETAEQLGVPFHNTRFKTMAYAAKRGISMEMAARDLRYAWFRQIAETYGYTKTATAHHREDAEETFILNLGRGSGIKGLQGIPTISGNVIRPMRYFSKQELMAFASEQGITYREDSTNNEDICQRNIVRHHVLPVLRRLNPSFDSNMEKSMRILHAQGAVYFNHIKEVAARLLQPEDCGYSISMESVAELPFPETYLFEILHPYGFNTEQIASLSFSSPFCATAVRR